MAICSYVVISAEGAGAALAARLASIPGCEVVPATNRELLLVVTETTEPGEDLALYRRLRQLEGVQDLVLTFGDLAAAASRAGPPVPISPPKPSPR